MNRPEKSHGISNSVFHENHDLLNLNTWGSAGEKGAYGSREKV